VNAPARLALFALAIAAAFGLGFGAGDAAGPFDDSPAEQPSGWHDGSEHQP
jgi:hypothetical protein